MAKYMNREVSLVSVTFDEPMAKIAHIDGTMETVELSKLILSKDEMHTAFKDLKDWGQSLEKRSVTRKEKHAEEFPELDVDRPKEKLTEAVTTRHPQHPAYVPPTEHPVSEKVANATTTPVIEPVVRKGNK